jgi:hypothetical protein
LLLPVLFIFLYLVPLLIEFQLLRERKWFLSGECRQFVEAIGIITSV